LTRRQRVRASGRYTIWVVGDALATVTMMVDGCGVAEILAVFDAVGEGVGDAISGPTAIAGTVNL
jgi:hypothetical protein